MTIVSYQEVYDFWFNEGNEEFWFVRNDEFDQELKERFYGTWDAGRQGLLYEWRKTFEGRLAEIIVLDQFSRNLNRGNALSYTQDEMALILAQHAILHPDFEMQPLAQKSFTILPFMHSESKGIQKISEKRYLELGSEMHIKYMYEHKEIIDQYGRYPYRNKILGRKSTPEELEFLKKSDLDFTNVE